MRRIGDWLLANRWRTAALGLVTVIVWLTLSVRDGVSMRALVFWWLISSWVGLAFLNAVVWVLVASRLEELRRRQTILLDAVRHARAGVDQLDQTLRKWIRALEDDAPGSSPAPKEAP